MASEPISVRMGRGYVTVPAEHCQVRYEGTDTGGSGCPNIERYTVTITIGGVQYVTAGTWDGDGRNNTTVEYPSRELRRALRPMFRSQQLAAERPA